MRSYESIIAEAELMALPPETVRARLIEYASQAKGYDPKYPLDEEAEEALRLRRDPLIDLSLAQYGRYLDSVKPIFHSNPPGSAVRLATLANRNFSNGFLSHFPSGLFEDLEGQIQRLVNAEEIEIDALFSNPTLEDRFLRSVLEQEGEFAKVPDERFRYIVSVLAYNTRMSTVRQSDYMDGQAEHDYDSVFGAAWALADKVEPTRRWAHALSWLYANTLRKAPYKMKPLEVAEKWRPDPTNAELVAKEVTDASPGFLSEYEMVRTGLARLACDNKDKLLEELLTHEDRAFRAAAYIDYPLTQEMIDAAHEKDGEMAFQYAIGNEHLWRTADGRGVLRSLAWAVNNADGSHRLDAPNQFRSTEAHMEKLHPDWFEEEPSKPQDDEDEIDVDDMPATRADLAQAFVLLKNEMENNKAGKRLNWIFWITLFIAVYVFVKLN